MGGITLAQAQARNLPEYVEMGTAMLTMAVFAICITAPLGAIFINTLGPMWLEDNSPESEKVFDMAAAKSLRSKDQREIDRDSKLDAEEEELLKKLEEIRVKKAAPMEPEETLKLSSVKPMEM